MTKLDPEDVEYLSFAGGGGKGGAYLGVMAAAAHEDIGLLEATERDGEDDWVLDTDQVKGVAGASAGAITAALVASNYSLKQFQDILLDGPLGDFFDPTSSNTSYQPTVRLDEVEPVDRDGTRLLGTTTYNRSNEGKWSKGIQWPLGTIIKAAVKYMESDQLTTQLDTNARAYSANLWYDMGLFSGCLARTKLSEWLVENVDYGIDLDAGEEVTFEDFDEQDDTPDLRLTGANLTTKSSEFFTAERTPPLKVADALRISMSIPGAFKPLEIGADVASDDEIPDEFEGVWVDGGVRNNHPIHAFDDDTQRLNPNVLGLQLGTEADDVRGPETIDGFNALKLGSQTLATIMESSGSGQLLSDQERDQTLNVPLGGITTLELQPPEDKLKLATKSAAVATFDYFEIDVGEDEVDELLDETLPDLGPWDEVESTIPFN